MEETIRPNSTKYSNAVKKGTSTIGCNWNVGSILNSEEMYNISGDDNYYVIVYKQSTSYSTFFIYNFSLPDYYSIKWIWFRWKGQSNQYIANGYNMSIWNFTSGKWITLVQQSTGTGGSEFTVEYNKTSGFGGLIQNNKVIFCSNIFDAHQSTNLGLLKFGYVSQYPQFFDINEPNDPSTYLPTGYYKFNVTVTAYDGVSKVFIEFNDTQNLNQLKNYSMSKSGTTYLYTFSDLPAGTYVYKFFANNTEDNWNSTQQYTFTIDKAIGSLELYLNDTTNDFDYPAGSSMNITAVITNPPGLSDQIYIYTNITGYSSQSGSNPYSLITERITKNAKYNITAYLPNNQNYTSATITRYANFSGNITNCDNGCLYIKKASNTIAVFDKFGNVDIKGSFYNTLSTPDGNDLIFKTISGTLLAWIDDLTGNFRISGSKTENQGSYCSAPSNSFVIKDNSGNCVSYIDSSGNLWLKGVLIENSNIS
ncbi:MAG: hypothetical protein QXJ06_00135 [Candidatus Aenigmatarchaeota archaeon]